jgi:hypothetical protein
VRLANAADALGETQLATQAYLGSLELVIKSNDVGLQKEVVYELLLVLSKSTNGQSM